MESNGNGGLVLLTKKSTSFSFFIFHKLPPVSLWKYKSPHSFPHHILLGGSSCSSSVKISRTSSIPSRWCRCSGSRWDSNAEMRRFKFDFKVQDENNKDASPSENGEVEVEEEEGNGYTTKRKKSRWRSGRKKEEGPGILEEAIDSLWVVKMAKSYGWLFPPIVISLVLATGPKAFLTVLALFTGQSLLAFAFGKLLGRTQSKPKRNAQKRRKPYARAPSDDEMGDEDQEEKQEAVKGRTGYWVVDDNGSVKKDSRVASQFGGWDALDETESMRQPPPTKGQSQRKPPAKGKLSMSGEKSDTPLLLRLLIAVFPFLGSWTKML